MVTINDPIIKKIIKIDNDYEYYSQANKILNYDFRLNMPPKALKERIKLKNFLRKKIDEKWQSKEYKSLLNEAKRKRNLSQTESAILRIQLHRSRYRYKVPTKIRALASNLYYKSYLAWREAREKNDFDVFLPPLKKIIETKKELAVYLGGKSQLYNSLLDRNEVGMTVERLDQLFEILKPELVSILNKIKSSQKYKNFENSTFHGKYHPNKQSALVKKIVYLMGYNERLGKITPFKHASTYPISKHDVRITYRINEQDPRQAYRSSIHEAGHARHRLVCNKYFSGYPINKFPSRGVSESQSRFWENHIGKSPEFLGYISPKLQTMFNNLKSVDFESLCVYFNQVDTSSVRTNSDEITYMLHIMLRYEIEKELIEGDLDVDDVKRVWNQKVDEYLGHHPNDDNDGILQDVHWSKGAFADFPSYALGDLYSAQFQYFMSKDLDFNKLLLGGRLAPILKWLENNIYKHGGIYTPDNLIVKVTKEKLNPKYYLKYIKNKYSKLYQVSL